MDWAALLNFLRSQAAMYSNQNKRGPFQGLNLGQPTQQSMGPLPSYQLPSMSGMSPYIGAIYGALNQKPAEYTQGQGRAGTGLGSLGQQPASGFNWGKGTGSPLFNFSPQSNAMGPTYGAPVSPGGGSLEETRPNRGFRAGGKFWNPSGGTGAKGQGGIGYAGY